MRAEACDEPLARLLRLKHGIGDKSALAAHDCDLRDGEQALDRVAKTHWIERVAGSLRVFAQRQKIEFEDFVDLGHLLTANV